MPLTKVTSGVRTLGTGEVATANMAVDPTNASNLSSGSVPSAQLGNVDTTGLEDDIALLGFKVATNGSLSRYNLVDNFVEDFNDSTGVDASASTNETITGGYCVGSTADPELVLLSDMEEGANHATTWTPTVTPSGAYFDSANNVRLDNASYKFGTQSCRWQSSPSQELYIQDNAAWDFGTGDFTVDFWCQFNGYGMGSGSRNSFVLHGTSAGGSSRNWEIAFYTGTKLQFGAYSGGSNYEVTEDVTWTTTAGVWTHVAVTRASGTLYLFHNGTLLNSGGTAFAHDIKADAYSLKIAPDAGDWDNNFDGYVDEFRILKGRAAWTAGFDVPTSAYSTTAPADLTLVSTVGSNTPSTAPTKGDMVMSYTDYAGTATLNTDIKGYVSRDNGTTWTQGTLASEGTSGGHKIVTFHDLDISSQPSGTSMKYKVSTHNQAVAKETRIQAVSLGWS